MENFILSQIPVNELINAISNEVLEKLILFLLKSEIGDKQERQMKEIKERLGEHDTQLSQIYDALENLLDEKAAQRKWDERPRIGFKKWWKIENHIICSFTVKRRPLTALKCLFPFLQFHLVLIRRRFPAPFFVYLLMQETVYE